MKAREEERFWAKVDRRDEDECWPWTGYVTAGYGRFYPTRRKGVKAHRYAYELLIGPIPAGLHLDHLCRNKLCMNPQHLEPVTLVENVMRGEGVTVQNAQKTHCLRGHEFTPENTRITPQGWRQCKVCRRLTNG